MKKGIVNLKDSKEGVYGRVWKEEGKGRNEILEPQKIIKGRGMEKVRFQWQWR